MREYHRHGKDAAEPSRGGFHIHVYMRTRRRVRITLIRRKARRQGVLLKRQRTEGRLRSQSGQADVSASRQEWEGDG
jgi:hypothetical protein